MSVQTIPNSGPLMDDNLDKLRAEALAMTKVKPLPESVVYYLRALESAVLDMKLQQRHEWMRKELRWPMEGDAP